MATITVNLSLKFKDGSIDGLNIIVNEVGEDNSILLNSGNQAELKVVSNFKQNNKIVLDYYTTEMIKDILSEKKLEEEIHTTFKNPKELEKIQLKNYLIKFVWYFRSVSG